MALPPVDRLLNTLEYFVHHEDIRRARPGWEPRELTDREQRILFKGAAIAGKGLVQARRRPRRDPLDRRRARALSRSCAEGDDPVVVTGDPAELTMFLFGRDEHTRPGVRGPARTSVDALTAGSTSASEASRARPDCGN